MKARQIESRAWIVWGVGMMVPILMARHPLLILEMLIIACAVRSVWSSQGRKGWNWLVGLASVFVIVGVLFNALTVHSGDRVLFTMPETIPLVGGVVTLNAIVYGIVSGLAILTLVLVGTTVGAGLVWADLMRTMPPRLAPLAVAGSVAWAFLPSAAQAFQEIRESQTARGHRVRGVRDLTALVVPLLGGGLERALMMSESLETRGFGASALTTTSRSTMRWLLIGFIGSGLLAAYAMTVGQVALGIWSAVVAIGFLLVVARTGEDPAFVPTRYRSAHWTRTDSGIVACSILGVMVFLWRRWVSPESVIFNPYPTLTWPASDPWMLLGIALLMIPALIVPSSGGPS